MPWQKKFPLVAVLGLLFLYGLLITQKINLVTADLGRHLKNGELILEGDSRRVWQTNLYSYTYPGYPFLNHHWGSGVIFYLIQHLFGFTGLSVFFTFLSLATFLIFFRLAWKSSGFGPALLAGVIVLPILASRIEIRPEVFSYLLAGIFWWILSESRGKRKLLWLLPALELLWVNLHIYFFLGLFLIGVFFLEELVLVLLKKGRDLKNLSYLRDLSIAGGLSLAASLVNPAGIWGVLYPLQIFKGYGYRLFENQTVWFLDKLVKYPPSLYFKIAFAALVLSWIYSFLKKRRLSIVNLLEQSSFAYLIFTIFYSFLGWTAVRNFALFGYFCLPVMAANLKGIGEGKEGSEREETALESFAVGSAAISLLVILFLLNPVYWQGKIALGLGLEKNTLGAVEFFQKEKLIGPVFNNYDNGGYLIYFLYPKEKVFVDNRPEAYPASFFNQTYIPMQEQEKKWVEQDKKYNFNAIFFYRNDLTPWGQTFLLSRITDPAWAPVYVDDWSIIFLKRDRKNEKTIQKFELPKEMFGIRKQ